MDPAWRVAFRAADERSMTGLGDLILGINAHVNNDMPFMIAATGTRSDDGKSHKKDHDLFNRNLSGTFDDVLEDVARRYDPTANVDIPGTELDKTAIYQLLALWREGVWRNAERLEDGRAPTPSERRLRRRSRTTRWRRPACSNRCSRSGTAAQSEMPTARRSWRRGRAGAEARPVRGGGPGVYGGNEGGFGAAWALLRTFLSLWRRKVRSNGSGRLSPSPHCPL